MWIRIKHSLTLRIFLMTCGLMIAVCAATYGAIAYLTPLTYTMASVLTAFEKL